MRNLPHHAFEHNQTWLELSLIAEDLLTWMKLTCLDGELATAEPKRLRHRLLHLAGKSSTTAAAHNSSSTATGPGQRPSPPRSHACVRSPRSADRQPQLPRPTTSPSRGASARRINASLDLRDRAAIPLPHQAPPLLTNNSTPDVTHTNTSRSPFPR